MKNEIRVLSAVVNNKEIAPVLNTSSPEQLFQYYGDAWNYIKDYYYKHRSVVPADIICEKFPDVQIVETSGTVKHYLEQLKEDYAKSVFERIARGLAKDIDRLPSHTLMSEMQAKLLDVINISNNIRDLDITDPELAIDHYIKTRKLMEENGGVLGIKSGYDSIDANYVTGFAPGQSIIILSRTGQGKSWWALDLAINAWAQGKKVLYISLEMAAEQVRDRAYTLMSQGQFKMVDLARAQIDIDEFDAWTDLNLHSSSGQFIVTGSDGMGDFSVNNLQAKIDQYGPDIVFVDYMQLVTDKRNSSGETERVRNASKEIKSTALVNGIPIVTIAAASSHETKEYNSPPQIYENAGSRQAAFDHDLVLALISRKKGDGTHIMEICARKNRHGPEFDFLLTMDITNGRFIEGFDEDEIEE